MSSTTIFLYSTMAKNPQKLIFEPTPSNPFILLEANFISLPQLPIDAFLKFMFPHPYFPPKPRTMRPIPYPMRSTYVTYTPSSLHNPLPQPLILPDIPQKSFSLECSIHLNKRSKLQTPLLQWHLPIIPLHKVISSNSLITSPIKIGTK